MPQRPAHHVLEDISRDRLRSLVNRAGWTCMDAVKDYGIDLLVQIFSGGAATKLVFFIQAKSTRQTTQRLIGRRRFVGVRVPAEHLALWREFAEPVVLTLFDATSGRTYWDIVQTALLAPSRAGALPKSRTVLLPTSKAFTLKGLSQIETLTRDRWHRLELEREGTDALIHLLKEEFGLVVVYDAQLGVLIVGRTNDLDGKIVFFGRPMRRLSHLMEQSGKPWGEEALAYATQYINEWMPGSRTELTDWRPGFGARLVVSFTLVPQDDVARLEAARLAEARAKARGDS